MSGNGDRFVTWKGLVSSGIALAAVVVTVGIGVLVAVQGSVSDLRFDMNFQFNGIRLDIRELRGQLYLRWTDERGSTKSSTKDADGSGGLRSAASGRGPEMLTSQVVTLNLVTLLGWLVTSYLILKRGVQKLFSGSESKGSGATSARTKGTRISRTEGRRPRRRP